MKGFLSLSVASILLFVNTIFWCSLLFLLTPLKFVLPNTLVRAVIDPALNRIASAWISGNSGWMKLTQGTQWQVELPTSLNPKGWYFVTSNHQSWVDILVLQRVLNGKIPFLKFFLKQELIRVPILGLAWWALDFPFMKRYSKSYLEKFPEHKGKDIATTQAACEKFKHMPTSVMNFFEGTRFSDEKYQQQQSPYQNLLKPKSGGFAFALNAMGDRFQSLLDCHIIYPHGTPSFLDFLKGEVPEVIVQIVDIKIPAEFYDKDYEGDAEFRQQFQQWISEIWLEKDQKISLMKHLHQPTDVQPQAN